ncbi:MAG: helix-turn-helix domain-containing protein [Candidatus Diapherotrites archaeon]
MTREILLQKIKHTLARNGFQYQDFSDTNSCFDVIARKQEQVLIIKVLFNIDALRAEHARDLKKMAYAFNGYSIIVGEKSKVFTLKDNVLYDRYELPVLSFIGFTHSLQEKFPMQRAYKGQHIVELDAQRLQNERKSNELTLKELSQSVGISLESLHRYEHGSPAHIDAAEKLERILHTTLVQPINVFEKPFVSKEDWEKPFSPSVIERLEEVGIKLSVFERAPITAAGKEHPLLVSHVENKHQLVKKAQHLEKAEDITQYTGMMISSGKPPEMEGKIPIIREDELNTFSSAKDILRSLREKKKSHSLREDKK